MPRTSRTGSGKGERRGDRLSREPEQSEFPFSHLQEFIRDTIRKALESENVAPVEESLLPVVQAVEPPPLMPVRRLHNFVYCARLFYYQWVENIFVENADTVEGVGAHRKADSPTRLVNADSLDVPEGRTIRNLHLADESLGLAGAIDVIEGGENGVEIIDYKKGSAARNERNERVAKEYDAVQVVAYAMLIEAGGQRVSAGWIYYAADKRRVPVDLGGPAKNRCRELLAEARAVAAAGRCPPPLKDDPRCLYCSAYPVCLPNESAHWAQPDATPPETTRAPRPPADDGEILVVQTPGATVGLRGGEVIVSTKSEQLAKLPVEQISAIYLYGAIQVTAQATQAFLDRDLDVAYFSPAGRFLGLLRGLPASGVDARLGQYRLFGEPGMRLRLSAEVVRAKIHNQRVLLMRNGDAPDSTLRALARLRDRCPDAADARELLGIEGAAAALYFEHFASMLGDRAQWNFDFSRRNRRPPRDPINALLSMGYSILAKELTGVCHTVGLDPFLGFFHQPRYGRPALALDLMEEFRPLVADSLAISLVNRGELRPGDFISSASGVFLNENGRRAYWEGYFRRLDTEVSHPVFDYKMSYRRMFEVQARQLWRFVRGEAQGYTGFTTR